MISPYTLLILKPGQAEPGAGHQSLPQEFTNLIENKVSILLVVIGCVDHPIKIGI